MSITLEGQTCDLKLTFEVGKHEKRTREAREVIPVSASVRRAVLRAVKEGPSLRQRRF